MGSIPDPGELTELTQPSFDEFQRQTSLMTSCTLLWKELSDHFTLLEQNLMKKSEALKQMIETLDNQTQASLESLKHREVTIEDSVKIAMGKAEESAKSALMLLEKAGDGGSGADDGGEVDDGDGLLSLLKSFCLKMDARKFWNFVTMRKKELENLRAQIPAALVECVDPSKFVLEAISEVFPVDKRAGKSSGDEASEKATNDLGWACVVILESLIPVMVDPVIGKSRLLVTPSVKEKAKEIAETWKASLEERGGIENVKTPDVHTFLQHLVTFGIVKNEDLTLYRKLVVGSAWRKQMPKLAVSVGLGDQMPDMIEELISRGQQLDAVHFTYEVGLVDKFPPVPLLKAYLRDAKKAAASIMEDPNNPGRAAQLAVRKEQSALRAVLKCIEEYKLEEEFPPENLKKRLDQLEKSKTEKRKPAAVPANKRTRASYNGPMPPAKAGRITNAYVSSFPTPPTYIRSPTHSPQYASPPYASFPPPPTTVYSNGSPPYPYSPEVGHISFPGSPISYPAPYSGYCNGPAPPPPPPPAYHHHPHQHQHHHHHQQAYY
ncbi:PREDICTED: FRIGIDA-like protein 4a [Tarenaya hassleriana]|uniref:FRIGIDA-like protein 4a n=1 Tax=Tarenaya hassleriana TaxID=28532 RepID=UPI00053C227D|nr:PREDICTED: FRIGIDA-like protein 4a [Tarenaya hassleriana]